MCRSKWLQPSVMSRQKGHAAILFVLMMPVLFGVFTLAVDGAKMMQNEARLDDALEIASLAVAAVNDDNIDDGSGKGSRINQDIATAYVSEYMQDMTQISGLKITKLECEDIPECVAGLAKEEPDPRFFEFRVEATTHHDTIFNDENTFGENYIVQSDGVSRKYQNHALDIVFVSDFSGSMDDSWSGGNRKYLDLVDVIEDVTVELAKFNGLQNLDDSRVAYVGFNTVTQEYVGKEEHSSWWWGSYTTYTLRQYSQLLSAPPLSLSVFGDESASGHSLHYDVTQTIEGIFIEKSGSDNYREVEITIPSWFSSSAFFYDIPLTTDFDDFNRKVASFEPNGYTAAYQGIIRAAQIAYLELDPNPRQLIIILSDGQDNYPDSSTLNSLVGAGMCSTITSGLDSRITSEVKGEKDVVSKIAVIGFDYNVDENTGLIDCAGVDNVYKAEDKTQILNIILGLIAEEIGHLK